MSRPASVLERSLWCYYGFVAVCVASYAGLGVLGSRLPYQGPDQVPARLVPYLPDGLSVAAQLAYAPSMVVRFLGELLTFGRLLPCTPTYVLGCYETPWLMVMLPQLHGFDEAWVILYVTAGLEKCRRSPRFSLADCFALALAKAEGVLLVATDGELSKVTGVGVRRATL